MLTIDYNVRSNSKKTGQVCVKPRIEWNSVVTLSLGYHQISHTMGQTQQKCHPHFAYRGFPQTQGNDVFLQKIVFFAFFIELGANLFTPQCGISLNIPHYGVDTRKKVIPILRMGVLPYTQRELFFHPKNNIIIFIEQGETSGRNSRGRHKCVAAVLRSKFFS